MTTSGALPRTLAEDLRGRDDTALGALLRGRPDLAQPVPADSAQLASRAATRASVVQLLDRLDRFMLDVVDACAVATALHDGPMERATVVRLVGRPAAEVAPAIERLRTLAVLWGADDALRLVRTVRDVLGPHPGGLGPPARQALLALAPSRIARIARDLGLTATGDPVADAEQIGDRLGDGASLDALLDRLGPDTRAALDAVAAGPPTAQVGNARRAVDAATALSPVDKLLAHGLLVPVESATVLLPAEVGLHMRGGRIRADLVVGPPSPATTERSAGVVDRTAAGAAAEVVRLVEALLESWLAAPPGVLRAGGLAARDLRRAGASLQVDDGTVALLAESALAAGLVGRSDDFEPVWLPTDAYDVWAASSTATQWAAIARAWLGMPRLPGLVGSRAERDRLVAPLGPDLDHPVAPEVRRTALEALAALPPGHAANPEDLLAVLHWQRPRRRSRLRDDIARWSLQEAGLLGVTGAGALSSFGRALLTNVSATAAALDRLLPTPIDHVLLQADLTAVAPGPLEVDLGRRLSLIADVESTGGATVYRFSADSVRRGLDAGQSAAEMQRFLAKVSRTPVPQPLAYLVDDVARRHGLMRVGSAESFVRCDDESALVELLADRRAAGLGLRRIAPTVVASQLPPDVLLARLRSIGLAPAAEAVDGSVVVAQPPVRRAPTMVRSGTQTYELPGLTDRLVEATVRALRTGDIVADQRPDGATAARMQPAEAIAMLREAADAGASVWIGYVDNHGVTSERVIDPVRLEGGWLTAFDHRSQEVRSFAVHRISSVAPSPG